MAKFPCFSSDSITSDEIARVVALCCLTAVCRWIDFRPPKIHETFIENAAAWLVKENKKTNCWISVYVNVPATLSWLFFTYFYVNINPKIVEKPQPLARDEVDSSLRFFMERRFFVNSLSFQLRETRTVINAAMPKNVLFRINRLTPVLSSALDNKLSHKIIETGWTASGSLSLSRQVTICWRHCALTLRFIQAWPHSWSTDHEVTRTNAFGHDWSSVYYFGPKPVM